LFDEEAVPGQNIRLEGAQNCPRFVPERNENSQKKAQ